MFYLPDETYRHRNKTIKVTFGEPISYKVFDHRKKPIEWAEEVKKYVYTLKDNPVNKFPF
jgi:hypothetical protein